MVRCRRKGLLVSKQEPVFVLGMPRCRTAWLSACLVSLGVDCTHSGMLDFLRFDEYAEDLDARLQSGPAGDADPALVCWLDDLLRRWPKARFVVIYRNADSSRDAFVKAAPGQESEIVTNWPLYVQRFLAGCDRLRADQAASTHFLTVEQLAESSTLLDLMQAITGSRPNSLWARRMQRLHVASLIEPIEGPTPPVPKPIDVTNGLDLIDGSGLQAAVYTHADFEMVNSWWESHLGRPLLQTALPPLGVVVSHEGEPWAAIWCYELYGVPIAELTFPTTRPGLSLADASRALMFGALACMSAAGKNHVPEARFTTFKVIAPRPMTRFLKRLGFKEYLSERVPMMITL